MDFLKELIIIVIFAIGLYKIMQFGDNRIQAIRANKGVVKLMKRNSGSRKKKTI